MYDTHVCMELSAWYSYVYGTQCMCVQVTNLKYDSSEPSTLPFEAGPLSGLEITD